MKRGKIQRILWAGLALLAAMGLLCGCRASRPAESGTLPELVIGSDFFEPFNYLGSDGEQTGVDVELAAEACRRMGYRPVFREIQWENKDEYLAQGEVDCLWGCFTMTGREDEYQWAGPYLYSRQTVLVRQGSGISTLADLEGKRVAVQVTGKAERTLLERPEECIPEVGELYAFSTMEEVYACLRKGYVDAIAGHEGALTAMTQGASQGYVMLEEALYRSELGVAFSKEGNGELARLLNETLREMREDGTIRSIAEKYHLHAAKLPGD